MGLSFFLSLDDAEEVQVGVVHGEVDGDEPGASGHPDALLEFAQCRFRLITNRSQVLDVAGARVGAHQAGVGDPVQVRFCSVAPPI